MWKPIASSVPGASHIKYGKLCQDYSNFCTVEDVIIGAVADGAGSAKYSQIGAELSVQTTLLYLKTWIEEYNEKNLQHAISKELAKEIFYGVYFKVKENLKEKAEYEKYTIHELACTLLAFIATPYWIAAMQIGDGFIVIRPISSNYKLLFKPDKGEYVNETNFVTSQNAQLEMKIDVISNKIKFICASTDGLERLAINLQNWEPFKGFFKPFEDGVAIAENLVQEKEDVEKLLISEYFNDHSDDDKTLLLCYYEELISEKTDTSKPYVKSNFGQQEIDKEIPGDFITVSFISHVFAGCLFRLFSKQQGILVLIFLVIILISLVLISLITFNKVLRWFFKKKISRYKILHPSLEGKTLKKRLKNIYQIREVIAWTFGTALFGFCLGCFTAELLSYH